MRLTMMPPKTLLVAALLASVWMAASQAAIGGDAIPVGFEVMYDVQYSGARIAETTFSLRPQRDSAMFELRSVTEPRGLAALIRYGDVVEESHFRVVASEAIPVDYRFADGTRKGKRNSSIFFDWSEGSAQSTYKNEDASLDLAGGEVDRLMLQWQIMRDLAHDQLPESYRVIDRNGLKEYAITRQGEELLSTSAGTFRTLKLRRQRAGSSRATLIWAAVEHGYLPVKMIQMVDEKPNVVLQVSAIRWGGGTPADKPEAEMAGAAEDTSAN
ncbi:MAG: DUF3108 domain-containing protein [Pseudomonadota bacterium]